MQRELLKAQLKFICWLIAPVWIAMVIGVAIQASHHNQTSHAVSSADNRAGFWKTVSGDQPVTSPPLANAFAHDLRERLGPIDSNASSLPDTITRFRGTSNTYGGITDAIGVDPFADKGAPCSECGPLTQDMQSKLLLVKTGHVDEVIRSEHPRTIVHGYTWTPLGMSFATFFLLAWLIFGAGSLMEVSLGTNRIISPKDVQGSDYSTWLLTLLCPFYFIPLFIRRGVSRRRFERKVRAEFGSYMAEIDSVDEILHDADHHSPQLKALRQARNELIDEVHRAVKAKDEGDVDFVVQRLERSMEDLRGALVARKDALEEMKRMESQ